MPALTGSTRADSTLTLRGEVYTVSGGFLTPHEGAVQLPCKDILSITRARHRSKKSLYVLLVLGCILSLALDVADFLPVPGVLTGAVVVAAVAIGAVHFFSARAYVEVVSMRGTFRVAVEDNGAEVDRVIADVQRML